MAKEISTNVLILRFIFIAFGYFAIYVLNNRFQLFSATTVPVTYIDQLIPFTPWGIYTYVFAYLFPALVFFRLWYQKKFEHLNFIQWHLIFATILGNLFFLMFPTTIINIYSRVNFEQLLEVTHPLTAFFLRLVYSLDQPYNCFPSLHVASAFVAAMSLHGEKRFILWSGYLLALLICLSTLQVKQHLFYDVIGGFFLSLMTYGITKVFLRYRPIQ